MALHFFGRRNAPISPKYYITPGHVVGPGRVGPGQQKPDSKNCCPDPARPDSRAVFSCPGPARRAKISSGRAFPKSTKSSSPARLVNRARFLCPGPARWAKIRGQAGPFLGRAGSGRRAGLPMLRFILHL
jgi:hypothetical protein